MVAWIAVTELKRVVWIFRVPLVAMLLTAGLATGGWLALTDSEGSAVIARPPVPTIVPAPSAPEAPDAPADGEFTYLNTDADGTPIRFDPCATRIRVVYDPRGEPYGAEDDVSTVTSLVSDAARGRLRYSGISNVSPAELADDSSAHPVILVRWVATTDDLEDADDHAVGQGGPELVHHGAIQVADVVLVASSELGQGLGAESFGVVLVHEMLHGLGLGHVDDEAQIMNALVVPGRPAELGDGDRAGLDALGAGCRR